MYVWVVQCFVYRTSHGWYRTGYPNIKYLFKHEPKNVDLHLIQGSQWNLETLEIWILSVQVQKWPGICPKKWDNLDKTRNLAKYLDKTWKFKIYTISILYWDSFFHVLYSFKLERLWCLPFGGKIVHTITWRMTFLTWTKPGDNLECMT